VRSSITKAAVGRLAIGATALGALAIGALAIGALSIGALSPGKLVLCRARVRKLTIDELEVGRYNVREPSEPAQAA
jgi:hypothetical protein